MATMPFDWSEYLRLATQLSTNADEAAQRTSMSRSYYCVYHKASERAVSTGYIDQQKHWKLWELYEVTNASDRICRKLGSLGSRMHKERKDADYDATATRITERMNIQLNRANYFMGQLALISAGLPRP
jgi:uncharacterized protein (UPF0332 family)